MKTSARSYIPVDPAIRLWRRSARRARSAPEMVFADPDSRRAAASKGHLPRPVLDPASSGSSSTWRRIASTRSRAEEIAAHAAGIAWKLQGADPLAKRAGGGFAEPARIPVLDAMERRRSRPRAAMRVRGCGTVNPHPDSLAEITIEYPYLQERYEQFADGDLTRRLRSTAARAIGICCGRPRKGVRERTPASDARTGSGACWRSTRAIWR